MASIEVKSEISGKVWKLEASKGDAVKEDAAILILESMKMEIPVIAPCDGTIAEILVEEEETVSEGQVVALIESA